MFRVWHGCVDVSGASELCKEHLVSGLNDVTDGAENAVAVSIAGLIFCRPPLAIRCRRAISGASR